MATIQTILAKYRPKIDSLDLELIIAHELKKSREFVLTYPEKTVNGKQEAEIRKLLNKRLRNEPLAHILGHKEFYGLDFKVTRDTLIPRPETEMLVELALRKKQETRNLPTGQAGKKQVMYIVDVGTGSGNIIISIAKAIESKNLLHASCYMLYGTDISEKALKIAKYNAKKNNVDKKIKFLHGNLLEPLLKNTKYQIPDTKYIILANLPYLSKKIYSATAPNVKNFEPKSALYSPKAGLEHYKKLLKQIKILNTKYQIPNTILELSPEQKNPITILVKKILPSAKIEFKKDLAGKWRVCVIELIDLSI
ncbi:MAG: peptide chain release factor N(5)-glutamine methyltransferase [Candidatus Moranbacteria bacterium]|nr:peptide chain release factor N(5)-glutamine methyltransferase [Candidatus Moranbacteria bacterium]